MINLLEDIGIGTREGMARHFSDMEETERRRKESDLVHLVMKKMEDEWIEGDEVMLPLSSFWRTFGPHFPFVPMYQLLNVPVAPTFKCINGVRFTDYQENNRCPNSLVNQCNRS